MREESGGGINKDVFWHKCMSWVKVIPEPRPWTAKIITEKVYLVRELSIKYTNKLKNP